MEEYLNHIDLIDKKFGGKDIPKHIIGFSLGGLLTLRLSLLKPNLFKSMALISPFVKLFNEQEIEKYRFIVKCFNYIIPGFRLAPFPSKELPPQHVLPWILDPIN